CSAAESAPRPRVRVSRACWSARRSPAGRRSPPPSRREWRVRNGAAALPAAALLGAMAFAGAAVPLEPVTWADVAASYAAVRDYTALYEKQERAIDGGA